MISCARVANGVENSKEYRQQFRKNYPMLGTVTVCHKDCLHRNCPFMWHTRCLKASQPQ